MQFPLIGGCQCGAMRYEIAEAPLRTYTCHCTDCQRITGSAFSLAIVVPDEEFRLTKGEPWLVQRLADSGRVVTRWLCRDCGSWVCSAAWAVPGQAPMRIVQGGSLDDRSWLRPTRHFWTRSKQPWVEIPAGDEVFETQPG